MQTVDFSTFLDAADSANNLPPGVIQAQNIYQGLEGIQFRSEGGELVQDVVRLGEEAFLFASDFCPHGERNHYQIVTNTDWVHLQFRLSGGGREQIRAGATIETPEGCCTIARYPRGSLIERLNDQTLQWRVVCLLVSPRGLTHFLDVPAPMLSERSTWLGVEDALDLHAAALPLRPAMNNAVNDILSCPFRGVHRRAYMRAKALELLTIAIDLLDNSQPRAAQLALRLSATDLRKLSLSRSIMSEELESSLTLAQLGRRVGLNRTKLALGFREIYGTSVQAYWRDAKLNRARELLRGGQASVTEVALRMGYAEISSFTRAFTRKFGLPPRDYRVLHE